MAAAVLLTCLAVVTGVLLARAQPGTPGDRTVAGPTSAHDTAVAGTSTDQVSVPYTATYAFYKPAK